MTALRADLPRRTPARVVYCLGTTCLLLAVAPAATAGGGLQEWRLTVSGPGLKAPIQVRDQDFSALELALGLVPASQTEGYSPAPPPPNQLGPGYGLRYEVRLLGDKTHTARQDLYPYAQGNPWTFTPSGQSFFHQFWGGEYKVRSGWFGASDTARGVAILVARGLPPTAPHSLWKEIGLSVVTLAVWGLIAAAAVRGLWRRKLRFPTQRQCLG